MIRGGPWKVLDPMSCRGFIPHGLESEATTPVLPRVSFPKAGVSLSSELCENRKGRRRKFLLVAISANLAKPFATSKGDCVGTHT